MVLNFTNFAQLPGFQNFEKEFRKFKIEYRKGKLTPPILKILTPLRVVFTVKSQFDSL